MFSFHASCASLGTYTHNIHKRMDSNINVHITIHTGATPRDYIAFLQTWFDFYTIKHKEMSRDLENLKAGLFKLDSATEIVNDLRTNAVQQEKA